MRLHLLKAGIWWCILTVLGEALVLQTDFNPPGYAREATIIDNSFHTLMVLGVPVFTFVVAVLTYTIWRFRAAGDPPEDGPPVHGHRRFTIGWLAVTSSLAALVIVSPGVTGMLELRHDHAADLTVHVESGRWFWRVRYPQHDVTTMKELVLPVDKRVAFEITSVDVVHSFWIPAFRIKIDAVPGLTTRTYAQPNRLGTYEQDDNLRVQCAELCGTGHYLMRMPVRVVTQAEFDAWIAQQRTTPQ